MKLSEAIEKAQIIPLYKEMNRLGYEIVKTQLLIVMVVSLGFAWLSLVLLIFG